jgi:hypothetical protein
MSEAKVKKHKKDYRELSRVRCACGCGRFLKQNVLDRNPAAKLCYFSYLLSKGKTHVFTGTVEVKGSSDRRKIYSAIKPILDRMKRRENNHQKQRH